MVLVRTRTVGESWKYDVCTKDEAEDIQLSVLRHNDEADYYGRTVYGMKYQECFIEDGEVEISDTIKAEIILDSIFNQVDIYKIFPPAKITADDDMPAIEIYDDYKE